MTSQRTPGRVDRFAAFFTKLDSGNFLYRPPGAATGLVVSAAAYEGLLQRLDQRRKLALVLRWLVIAGSAIWGAREYARSGSVLVFVIPFGLGCGIAFLLSLWTHLDLLRPFERDRRRLEKDGGASRTMH
ncbi:hypothetical protein N0B51_04715 [Tsuneonella sp. YG55]|uniref:Uncharacterized protein n=1 Tax=Tsuneonella litorea TaxID=2976475 RepID=A0A9X2VZH9_9SPHN|nr:hypothetical protein [Tsuneonella litorea]MCT2558275.1 hypothetical protein [Tsuneonella litorea]